MKKKIIIYCSTCIFVIGVCLLLFMNKKDLDDNGTESVPAPADSVMEIKTEAAEADTTDVETIEVETTEAETTEVYIADSSEEAEEDTNYALCLEDEAVRNNSVLHAFVNKEITAYDEAAKENKYIYEYFYDSYEYGDAPIVFGVHYMAEDLDGDGKDELLVLLQWMDTMGDLLVFHEADGKLYAWETWKDFLYMRMMDREYYGNGVFSQGGGEGEIFGRYNAEGKIEYIIVYYRWLDGQGEDGGPFWSGKMTLYKEGVEEKELTYEGVYYWDDDVWETTPEDQAIKDECDAILDELRTELGEGKWIGGADWEEDAEKIPLDELLNKQ